MGLGIIRAEPWNICCGSLSASVLAQRVYLRFLFYLQILKQYWALVVNLRVSNILTTASTVRWLLF